MLHGSLDLRDHSGGRSCLRCPSKDDLREVPPFDVSPRSSGTISEAHPSRPVACNSSKLATCCFTLDFAFALAFFGFNPVCRHNSIFSAANLRGGRAPHWSGPPSAASGNRLKDEPSHPLASPPISRQMEASFSMEHYTVGQGCHMRVASYDGSAFDLPVVELRARNAAKHLTRHVSLRGGDRNGT